MNVILNIEIKTQLNTSDKIEFLDVLKEQLTEHLLDAKLVTVLVKPKTPTLNGKPIESMEQPTRIDKNIHLKLNVPIEHDECGRRKSPTYIAGKYLDKWIGRLQPDASAYLKEVVYPKKTVDLATMSIKKYNEKYKTGYIK